MKYTLDLDELAAEGKITPEERDRLKSFAKRGTGALGVRILYLFGAVAVGISVVLLMPGVMQEMLFALVRGLLTQAVGHLLLIGVFGFLGIRYNSGFWVTLAALALFGFIGSSTGYAHASYTLEVRKPVATVLVFGSLWAVSLWLTGSGLLPARFERITVIFSRACLFFCNLGFWVGSLWGGGREHNDWFSSVSVPAGLFSFVWAVALVAAAVLAVRMNRRAMLNTVAVFGGIHLYTQYFEHLGANPLSFLFAGLLLIAISRGLMVLNNRMHGGGLQPGVAAPPAQP